METRSENPAPFHAHRSTAESENREEDLPEAIVEWRDFFRSKMATNPWAGRTHYAWKPTSYLLGKEARVNTLDAWGLFPAAFIATSAILIPLGLLLSYYMNQTQFANGLHESADDGSEIDGASFFQSFFASLNSMMLGGFLGSYLMAHLGLVLTSLLQVDMQRENRQHLSDELASEAKILDDLMALVDKDDDLGLRALIPVPMIITLYADEPLVSPYGKGMLACLILGMASICFVNSIELLPSGEKYLPFFAEEEMKLIGCSIGGALIQYAGFLRGVHLTQLTPQYIRGLDRFKPNPSASAENRSCFGFLRHGSADARPMNERSQLINDSEHDTQSTYGAANLV